MSNNFEGKGFVLKVTKLQEVIKKEVYKHTTNPTAAAIKIAEKTPDKFALLKDNYLLIGTNKKGLSELYSYAPYIRYFRQKEKSFGDNGLAEGACRNFLTYNYDNIDKLNNNKKWDFFAVFLGFEGWYDAEKYDFDIEKKNTEISIKSDTKEPKKDIDEPIKELERILDQKDFHLSNEIVIENALRKGTQRLYEGQSKIIGEIDETEDEIVSKIKILDANLTSSGVEIKHGQTKTQQNFDVLKGQLLDAREHLIITNKSLKVLPYIIPFFLLVLILTLYSVLDYSTKLSPVKKVAIRDLGKQFISTDSNTFRLLIVPFQKKPIDEQNFATINEQQLLQRFQEIAQKNQYKLEVQLVETTEKIANFVQAKAIVDSSHIDLIIWGQFESNCQNGDRICINYSMSDSRLMLTNKIRKKTNGTTEFQELKYFSDLNEGYLQESIDDIVFWGVANYHAKRAEFRKASLAISRIIDLNECNLELLSKGHEWAFLSGQYSKAQRFVKSIITCQLTGNPEPDINADKLYELNPVSAISIIDLADDYCDLGSVIFQSTGDPTKALRSYSHALKIDSNYARAWFGYGFNLKKIGKTKEAIRSLKKAVNIDPSYISAWVHLASIHGDMNSYEKMVYYYQKAIQIDSTDAVLWTNLGNGYNQMQDYRSGVYCFEKSIELDSTYFHIYLSLAVAYGRLKNFDNAFIAVEKALSLDSLSINAWSLKGEIHSVIGEREEAIKCLEKITELYPKDPSNWLDLANRYRTYGNLKKAIKELTFASSLHPKNISVILNLACFHLMNQQTKVAKQHFERVLYLDPNHNSADLFIGFCYLVEGNDKRALKHMKINLDKWGMYCGEVIVDFNKNYKQYLKPNDVPKLRFENVQQKLRAYCSSLESEQKPERVKL